MPGFAARRPALRRCRPGCRRPTSAAHPCRRESLSRRAIAASISAIPQRSPIHWTISAGTLSQGLQVDAGVRHQRVERRDFDGERPRPLALEFRCDRVTFPRPGALFFDAREDGTQGIVLGIGGLKGRVPCPDALDEALAQAKVGRVLPRCRARGPRAASSDRTATAFRCPGAAMSFAGAKALSVNRRR